MTHTLPPGKVAKLKEQRGDLLVTLTEEGKQKYLVADVTVVHPISTTHLKGSAELAGAAAKEAEKRKLNKYKAAKSSTVEIVPLAFESFGRWGEQALKFLRRLARTAQEMAGRAYAPFMNQAYRELSVALARGNAVLCWRAQQRLVERCGVRTLRGSTVLQQAVLGRPR